MAVAGGDKNRRKTQWLTRAERRAAIICGTVYILKSNIKKRRKHRKAQKAQKGAERRRKAQKGAESVERRRKRNSARSC